MGRKRNSKAIQAPPAGPLYLVALAGSLGAWNPSAGGPDPQALLAWLALSALPLGMLSAQAGRRLWPQVFLVPSFWTFVLVFTQLFGVRHLPAPLGAMAVITGFFLLGYGLARVLFRAPLRPAALTLLLLLFLAGAAQRGGLGDAASHPARVQPRLTRLLVDASPLVMALECAEIDWTHANPAVYRQSGVEWIPRSSYNGQLFGPGVLALGALLAFLADFLGRRRELSEAPSDSPGLLGNAHEPPHGV